ncbi:MAG: Fic family protein [Planctomycetes bacterium]|nr:Fic family protein [Planctomycetota bacterium]
MMTLRNLSRRPSSIPTSTSWLLADLGEARGKQDLFTRQAPQRLKALREHALVESAVSSTRIEGVEVAPARVATLIFGKPLLRDREEEEVRGYRDALELIHEEAARLRFSEATLFRLHRLVDGGRSGAGTYKSVQNDIIERYANGRSRVRFHTVAPAKTAEFMRELIVLGEAAVAERWIHPMVVLAAVSLDFLCIHPFRDGNGRVSRLLLLLQCYHLGLEVGRYISLERLIEHDKDRYYEALEASSHDWHHGRHDPWPFVNFVLFVLKSAYREFEQRVGETAAPRGSKTGAVLAALRAMPETFSIGEVQRRCPVAGVDLLRRILKRLKAEGRVECMTRGRDARWRKTRKWTGE